MQINEAALNLLREFEGLRLQAYLCPAGVWTIGYGHTAGVYPGQVITLAEADRLLANDVEEVAQAVRALVKVKLGPNRMGALVCFAFNIGLAAFKRSTLLARINRGELDKVPDELRRWSHARGIRLPGLVRRRDAETALWNRQD